MSRALMCSAVVVAAALSTLGFAPPQGSVRTQGSFAAPAEGVAVSALTTLAEGACHELVLQPEADRTEAGQPKPAQEAAPASPARFVPPEVTPEQAKAAFERFKTLEGEWIGRSTKGWEERVSYKTIAAGSCVLESSFDAHPNEMMLTLVHMDIDRLMLTHYCVARNQPRLLATRISESGDEILFTFLDGTNMKSRDAGHMDSCRVVFEGPDVVITQWTWYAKGQENWMEEIRLERLPREAPAGK